jgi:hypothetical protein
MPRTAFVDDDDDDDALVLSIGRRSIGSGLALSMLRFKGFGEDGQTNNAIIKKPHNVPLILQRYS